MKRSLFPLFGCAALLLSCEPDDPYAHCGPAKARVTNVIDGDTVELETGDRIRYILIDAPELTKGDCWASEALDANMNLVLDREVTLRYDAECRDRYGRLLAFVSVNDIEVNRRLIEEGHACLYVFPPAGESRADEFEEYEFQAKVAKKGVWGACGPVTCEHPR